MENHDDQDYAADLDARIFILAGMGLYLCFVALAIKYVYLLSSQ